MSEEKLLEWEKVMERLISGIKLLIAGAFAMGGWVAVIQYQTSANVQSITTNRTELRELSLWKAETTANRFTTQDYVRNISPVSDSLNGLDKRTTRLEDNAAAMLKALDRIELKLGTK